MKTERADILLVKKGLVETREKAKRIIMAGLAYKNEEPIAKPGDKIPLTADLRVKEIAFPYVSRGGFKLEKAINSFTIDLRGKVFLDIGSSTGGFTDCALQNGAELVYALDVGTNQLVWSLRNDERVIVMEKTNFRHSKAEDFQHGTPEVVAIDVSFISLRYILPVLRQIIASDGNCICLVKPQFEAGRDQVGKKGIVRDEKVHLAVLQTICNFAQNEGYSVMNLTYSPITGSKGNVEYLLHLQCNSKETSGKNVWNGDFMQLIKESHELRK